MLRSPLQRVKSFATLRNSRRRFAGDNQERPPGEPAMAQKVLRRFGTTVPLTLQLLKPILTAVEIYLPAVR
jgi:hypothetical protein